ncbi:MAG: acyl-CoA dehydrogenase family protein [Dehalococcoidia bacterium]
MPNPLLEKTDEVAPLLREESAAAEQARQMPQRTMDALIDAGFFRTWIPKAYGGFEMPPLDAFDVFERLALVDSAAGWVVSNCAFISTAYQNFPEPTVRGIMQNPRAVIAGSFVGAGTARAVEGGYVVNGKWSFGSACHHASDMVGAAVLVDDNGPIHGPTGGPTLFAVHLQPGQFTIQDNWHVLGLRGTGSHDYAAADLFVEAAHTFALGAPAGNPAYSGPLYRLGAWIDASRIAVVALAIAKAAHEDFMGLAKSKTPAYMAQVLSERATIQERAARARALIEAGKASVYTAVGAAWEAVQDGPKVTPAEGISMGLAAAFGLDAAVQAVELLYECAGSTAFRDSHPFQKRFRDVQVLRGNAITSWPRYESLGKLMMGLPSDWMAHNG